LHREILNSHTYQRTWRSNATNRFDDRLFSKAAIRRLPAEVVADAVRQATADLRSPQKPPKPISTDSGMGSATRYIGLQVPAYERRMDYSMLVFGKPIRKTNCDCERQSAPSLLQAVYLRNDADVAAALDRADGWFHHLPAEATPSDLATEAYLRVVSRRPTEAETARCLRHFEAVGSPTEALQDLLWALLNTQEFVTNH
jgi:hypothetical protein